MSADLTHALRTAGSGLIASQQSLDTIARNVANVNTPGYSRRIVNLEQRALDGLGAGVQFGALTRRVDQGLLRTVRQETSQLQATNAENSFLQRLQDLFGKPESDTALSHRMADLQSALETLATAPQDTLQQREVVRAGSEVASLLRQSSANIQGMRLEADQQIATQVDEINNLLTSIADLNDKIVYNRAVDQSVVDLEDTREQALDRLAAMMDIRSAVRGNGEVVVFTASGRTLVDKTAVTLSHTAITMADPTITYAGDGFDGIYIGEAIPGNDITRHLRAGELAGLVKTRDTTLPDLQSTLDELAVRLRETINTVHNRGAAFPGLSSMSGSRSFNAPATQTITFDGTTDTALILFDAAGNEVAHTTVRTLLDDASVTGGAGDATATINELATALNGSLGGALSASVMNGKLAISVTTPGLTLALRDQATSADGGTPQDAVINFDSDGVGGEAGKNFAGFSAFFGLNDFFVDAKGLQAASTGVSSSIKVRADIAASPARVASGAVQWHAGRAPAGGYALSVGDDTVAQQLAAALDSAVDFGAAGRVSATSDTLAGYAATLIGDASALAAATADRSQTQTELVEALKQKSDSIRGVNLDEELSDLMLYEQSYAAAARVVSVLQEMFDVLNQALA